jgi:hypothetical protein
MHLLFTPVLASAIWIGGDTPLPANRASAKPVVGATVIKAVVCLMALVWVSGCASFRGSGADRSWSQTAAREDQEEQQSALPDGGLTYVP